MIPTPFLPGDCHLPCSLMVPDSNSDYSNPDYCSTGFIYYACTFSYAALFLTDDPTPSIMFNLKDNRIQSVILKQVVSTFLSLPQKKCF